MDFLESIQWLIAKISGLSITILDDAKCTQNFERKYCFFAHASTVSTPKNTEESILHGGCHAYFGSYGAQDGDGIPTITNEEQIRITADEIARWINKL